WVGVLAVIIGIIALAWPNVSVYALVILFAVYAFIDASLEAMRAFSSRTAGPVFGHLLLGLISLAAGVIALVWPGPTALVLMLIVAIWAFVAAFSGSFAALSCGQSPGPRSLSIITPRVSAAFAAPLTPPPP